MIIVTIEDKATCGVEFRNADATGRLVECLLDANGVEGMHEAVTERVSSVYTVLRCQYRYDIDTAYAIAINSLVECLLAGDCPTKTSIQHYREGAGEQV